MLNRTSWRKLFNGSVQELKDVEETTHFLDGPLASCVYPSDVERSLALTASLVMLHSDSPLQCFPPHRRCFKTQNTSFPSV